MSGPWDRPSSPDPDDRDRSETDRESPPDHAQSAEPWSPADPWHESRPESSDWDAWPPPAPPPDDAFTEPGSSQDIWAESWEEEAAAMGAAEPEPRYEPAPVEPTLPFEPGPDATAPGAASYVPAPDEPAPYEPAPYEPAPYEPAPYEPAPYEPAPHEPPQDEHAPSEAADGDPADDPAPDEQASTMSDEVEPAPEAPVSPEPWVPSPAVAAGAAAAAAPVLPDWLAEPIPDWPSRDLGATDEPEPGVIVATPEPGAAEPSEPTGWLDAGPVSPPPFLEDAPDIGSPVLDDTGDEPAAGVPEEDDDDDRLRWGAASAAAGAAASLADAGEPEVGRFAAVEPAAADAAAVEPAVVDPAAVDAEPAPAVEEAPVDHEAEDSWPPPWLDNDESTRVLPTDWTPPPPVAPREEIELEPDSDDASTALGEPEAELDTETEPGSTAEQAVPWLIGLILLLAGMVIVLLALIFAGDGSLGGSTPEPSSSLAAVVPTASASASPTPVPSASASAAPSATPTPVPAAVYGPLEMIYQGRAAALAPIYLLLHDFTTEDDPMVLAQDPTIDVRRFSWAPDGTVGAGLLADVLVSIEIGESKRNLGEGLMTLTFGSDATTVYAVRVTADGGDDVATVLSVDFASGEAIELASVSYARPEIGSEPALPEAQFTDDGGTVRLFWMHDGTLRLWVLGASTWQIDPASGEATDLEGDRLPALVDPDGTHSIELVQAEDGESTTLRYLNLNGNELESTTAPGLVSHLRWSWSGDRIVFTVGRAASGGGVLQDLYLWDLDSEAAPMQITNTGAAFGADWRGTNPRWEDG